MDKMEMWLEKAQTLNEALPYIQHFHGKIIVVKYGGSAMVDHELKKSVIRDVALLKLVGFKPIIVHGGGKEITKWVNKAGLETNFVNGLRVTDKETMEIAEMVLNKINKGLASMLEKLGVPAVGISGKDGTTLKVDKKLSGGQDIGYVGQIKEVNTDLLQKLLDDDFVPVVCPIGSDDNYHSYNINADDAACAIAAAMGASKLAFLTDIEGVYRDYEDKSSLISEMSVEEAEEFLAGGHAGGGMLPKLQNCIDAVKSGVSRVHILDGRIAHCLLLEFFTDSGVGTVIGGVSEGENKMNPYIDQTEQAVLHTYNRFPIVLESGEGVYLKDTDGKEYLDFGAGIAVYALGYHYPGFDEALKAQIDKIIHTSNLYYNVPLGEAAQKLQKASGMEKVFFTNSGTEAVEGAIKAAKKYAYLKDGQTDHEIIAMNHSFHGRSVGALSVTGNPHYQEAFKPLMGGVKFADFNDLDSVKAQINDKTCAIIMETVQGEGGIYPAEEGFLKGVKVLCEEKDILLILDEIQCGMGRTGAMFAWQKYGVEPDIMTCAKALGCGVPVGAFVLNKKVSEQSLVPGDHGTTYGGNPLACAAVSKVFDLFESEKIVAHVQEITPYLEEKLDELIASEDCLITRRGMGMMQGIVVGNGKKVGDLVKAALDEGLVVISAGNDVLRLVPPLIIEKKHIDEMTEKLKKAVRKF